MGLAHPRSAIDEQGIECRFSRFLGYFESSRACQTVAVALDEIVEGVVFVQLRVDLQFLQSGNDEGIDRSLRQGLRRGPPDGVFREVAVRAGHRHRVGRVGAVHPDLVGEFALRTDEPLDGSAQMVDEMGFEELDEERTGHFDEQGAVGERHGHNGLKPRRIALLLDVVLDDLKAIIPYLDVVVAHRCPYKVLMFSIFFKKSSLFFEPFLCHF